jgi:uncharacterized integral membrane protein (TIGR00697 family)
MSTLLTPTTSPSISTYRLLTLFLVLNVAFQLISDATAGKIVSVFGFDVSVTVLYFPFVYIISDVVTEVYGYARARMVLWYTLLASVIAGVMYQVAVAVPAASFFTASDAYATVFGIVPRVLVGGWLAVFAGDISNNYTLAGEDHLVYNSWTARKYGRVLSGCAVRRHPWQRTTAGHRRRLVPKNIGRSRHDPHYLPRDRLGQAD